MKKIISYNESETYEIGKIIGRLLPKQINICLVGDLGVGKTHLVKGICDYHNLLAQFSSPTYTIVNKYENEKITIYHMDAYRLDDISQLEYVDFYEYYDKEILIIEWADIIRDEIKENALWINIEKDPLDLDKRIIYLSSCEKYDYIIQNLEEIYG